jgi:hypothetical protein
VKPLSQLLTDWRNSRIALQKLDNDIPRIIGNEAVRAIKSNFKIQGYDNGRGVRGWVHRAAKTDKSYDRGKNQTSSGPSRYRTGKNSTYKGSVFSSSNPLEVQTHNLLNSVKYKAFGRRVFIGVDTGLVPYAKIQNEGGRGIPARQYMPKPSDPPNPKMLKQIDRKIVSQREKALALFKR